MSVYIKGVEMPKSCDDCKAFVCYRQWAGDVGDCFCGITKNDAKAKEKNADCPLVPVPPHGDLIDRQAFRYEMDKHYPFDKATQSRHGIEDVLKSAILQMLFDAPTIIPASKEGEG